MKYYDWYKITSEYAQSYDGFRGSFSPETIRHILTRAHVTPQKSVILDLACGTGAVMREMFGRSRLIVGMDAATPMIAHARDLYQGKAPGLCLVRAVGERLPIAPACLDLVTIGQAIHWFDLSALFPELLRVLRPGGWLAVVSRYPSPAGTLNALVDRLRYPFTEAGQNGAPLWNEMSAPSNLLGLEDAGFTGYERTVIPYDMVLSVDGYLRGAIERASRRIDLHNMPAFRTALENHLHQLAQNGALREPFFDYLFMAQRPE